VAAKFKYHWISIWPVVWVPVRVVSLNYMRMKANRERAISGFVKRARFFGLGR
jgi:hypothetical protein